MKIGVDGVLIGAWADVSGAHTILDAGTGCGVVALMCAQRNAGAYVYAIDIDQASIDEAAGNFSNSPWGARMHALMERFGDCRTRRYDLIVSNPPYFDSGVSHPDTSRLKARHKDELSPEILITVGPDMLAPGGKISMIVPSDQTENLLMIAEANGLGLVRLCRVKGHPTAPVKRTMLEFSNTPGPSMPEESGLTLELSPGTPTEQYRHLCKDFYLKF